MIKTVGWYEAQIAKMQAALEEKKKQERGEVLARIKDAIRVYGFTREEIEGKAKAAPPPVVKEGKKKAWHGKKKPDCVKYPPFGDSEGNRWTGMGSIPRWMQPHIAAGKTKEDFRLSEFERKMA